MKYRPSKISLSLSKIPIPGIKFILLACLIAICIWPEESGKLFGRVVWGFFHGFLSLK